VVLKWYFTYQYEWYVSSDLELERARKVNKELEIAISNISIYPEEKMFDFELEFQIDCYYLLTTGIYFGEDQYY